MASKPIRPYTEENTNYARTSRIIVELCRDALWDFLTQKISPVDLPSAVVNNLSKLNKLHDDNKTKFRDFQTNSKTPVNTDLDFTALYTLIRNLIPKGKLKPPSNGWGKQPDPSAIKMSDDIERMRQNRNMLYGHITQAALSKADYQKYSSDLEAIFKRIDGRLGTKYKQVFDNYSSCVMDPQSVEDFRELLMEQVEYDEETRHMVGDLKQAMEDMKVDVETVKDDVDTLKGCVEQLQTSSDIKEERLNAVEERQKVSERHLDDLKMTQEKQTAQKDKIRRSVKGQQKKLDSLTKKQRKGQENYGQLVKNVESLEGDVDTILKKQKEERRKKC